VDPFWISAAFLCGFAVRQVGLPPLVGFLLAGFGLNALGFEGGPVLADISEAGVTLLLFCIGLKLRVKNLFRPEIWGGAGLHMTATVLVFGAVLYALGIAGITHLAPPDVKQALLLAFILSFSSTVFAVKILEDRAEMASFHGRVAIGILIMQDLLAVIFLAASRGQLPSPWALLVVPGLLLFRPVLMHLMDRSGHGEMMILCGFLMALVFGAGLFELVGLKADLGALFLGILLAPHAKAPELAKHLMGFKDFFLVGFFLTIGLSGLPTPEALGTALLLVALLPFKIALFLVLLTRFKLRARTALLASLNLANYSEFGLIVAAVATANGWIAAPWLTIIAVALSLTFVLAAPLNMHADRLYQRFSTALKRLETPGWHPTDAPIDHGDAQIAIFGMGRLGTCAYDAMVERHGGVVIGVDFDPDTVRRHQDRGRNVIFGDPTDPDFWARTRPGRPLRLTMLAMPEQAANLAAAQQVRAKGFADLITATARFDDEIPDLEEAGADMAYHFYNEAGWGFAAHADELLEKRLLKPQRPLTSTDEAKRGHASRGPGAL
jgi:glutathione-regulated potassium-efflux system ancillary protein KefC